MMKILKIIGKLLIGIFISLIIYFSVAVAPNGWPVLALFCAMILAYLIYLNKYKY